MIDSVRVPCLLVVLVGAGCGGQAPPLVATWQVSTSLHSIGPQVPTDQRGPPFPFLPIDVAWLAAAYDQRLTLTATGRFTSVAQVQLRVPVVECSMGFCHSASVASDCLVSATYEGKWAESDAGVLGFEATTRRAVSWAHCREAANDRTEPDGPISGQAAQVRPVSAVLAGGQLELDFGAELSSENGTKLTYTKVP